MRHGRASPARHNARAIRIFPLDAKSAGGGIWGKLPQIYLGAAIRQCLGLNFRFRRIGDIGRWVALDLHALDI